MNDLQMLARRSNRPTTKRSGLILLVVLGMLALFSLLSVTYVVFASQSRATSVALARKQIRGDKSRRPLFDESVKQLLRGDTNNLSVVYGQSILGDLYGERESVAPGTPSSGRLASLLQIRNWQYNPSSLATTPLTYTSNSYQRPMLLGGQMVGGTYRPGHYLRIPLNPGPNYNAPINLPLEHDVLNGRVVTFPDGNGPLSGQSFHIVRYIGRIAPFTAPTIDQQLIFAQNYSIVIDLLETDLTQSYSRYDTGTSRVETLSLDEWVNAYPAGAGNGQWQAGVYACFEGVDLSAARTLSGGYQLLLNAAALNSHGVGVYNDGRSQTHVLDTAASSPLAGTPINQMATGLLPHFRFAESQGQFYDADNNPRPGLDGDTDEPYDAADFNNWFLAYREEGATSSAQIIPSFHRASLINYIINWKDPTSYTPQEFLATVRRIESACGRPLSINVVTPVGGYVAHPQFSGSNAGGATQTPQLVVNIPGNWNTDWPVTGLPAFIEWAQWLTQGPWDVDNDADGVPDSMWVDVGLPLETSADGKLLKAMVAYYVEDLDNKLNVNAHASLAQTLTNYTAAADAEFARYNAAGTYLSQGVGYGPAEISFRHLFFKPTLPYATLVDRHNAFQQVVRDRYRNSISTVFSPGMIGDDAISQLRMREQRDVFQHGLLPGLPLGTHGRATIALDRLANPRVMNVDAAWTQSLEDPYEARLMTAPFQDAPYTFAEWERIYRIGDADRTAFPSRLETAFGELPNTIATSNLRHEITPHSAHLRVPMLASRGLGNSQIPTSFYELVNTIRQLRGEPTIPMMYNNNEREIWRGFASLFPLEFQRGLPMDLNRPLGNGVDDDGDGQIDEPEELFNVAQRAYYINGQVSTAATGVNEEYLQGQPQITSPDNRQPFDPHLDYSGAGTPGIYARSLETRQLYARHLYCLAQLILPADYVFPNIDTATFNALPANEKTLLRAKILAQWAVNVVDFRDLDSSMTRFPYDPTPFATKTDSGGNSYVAWEPPTRSVVWGMEQPELLMTESLATHDIRIKRDDMASPPRYNQYRIPEGSLFLEFFCPRTTSGSANQNAAGVPTDLYNSAGVALDLTRLAPLGAPVWRVYISGPQDPTQDTPLDRYNDVTKKHLLSYQIPESNHRFTAPDMLAPNADQAALDAGYVFDADSNPVQSPDPNDARILVFASGFNPTVDNSPGVADPASQVFVSETNSVQLRGGEYLVVGPRANTFFGSKLSAWSATNPPVNRPNNHRIELSGGWAQMYKTDAAAAGYVVQQRGTMRNCFTMIASSRVPSSWQGNSDLRQSTGLNVSEPLPKDATYYKEPTTTVNPNDNSTDPDNGAVGFGNVNFKNDAYYDYNVLPPLPEAPFDNGSANSGPLEKWIPGQNMTTGSVNVGTQENFCTAYLQRLADPEKPWDATFNPYLTVDWIPIDLTVFSGEENHPDVYPASPPPGQEIRFATRQKTGHPLEIIGGQIKYNDTSATDARGVTFYSPATHAPRETTPLMANLTFFDYEAFMDEQAGTAAAPIRPTPVDLKPGSDTTHVNGTFMTLGFLNSTYRIAGEEGTSPAGSFLGVPADPVADPSTTTPDPTWIPLAPYWTNRSFANVYEMSLVPLSAPGQFMQEFSALDISGSRYAPVSATGFNPFRHLLSFKQEFQDDASTPAMMPVRSEIPMSTMFELVETASPWSDANAYENPEAVGYRDPSGFSADWAPLVASTNNALASLRAPYNRISRFAEPGRLNLNTLAETNVFHGLWYNTLTPNDRQTIGAAAVTGAFGAVANSRRGYTAGGGFFNPDPAKFNPDVPTQFAGVFKPGMEAGMVPATRSGALDANAISSPANATLARALDPATGAQALFSSTDTFAAKNALTDSQPMTRLANLTSGRSNVFAVYVTLGFFEFDEASGAIQGEYGADKGEAQRYKAFYVIDRSRPVGFQVGVDHNVEKAIVVRRYLSDR